MERFDALPRELRLALAYSDHPYKLDEVLEQVRQIGLQGVIKMIKRRDVELRRAALAGF